MKKSEAGLAGRKSLAAFPAKAGIHLSTGAAHQTIARPYQTDEKFVRRINRPRLFRRGSQDRGSQEMIGEAILSPTLRGRPRSALRAARGQAPRPSRGTQCLCSRSAAGGGAKGALELGELGRGGVGDGPKAKVALVPMPQVVTLPAEGLGAVAM
jgi:hypothetical protein